MENYLIAILVIVTVLLIVQAAVFIGFYFLARRVVELAERVGQLQTRAEFLLNNTEPLLRLSQQVMSEFKEASGYFAQGAQHISAIVEMTKDEVADVKDLLGDTTALARREIERTRARIDQVQTTLATATDQFERTVEIVQHRVLEPAREFSYVMAGVRRALETLTAGKRLPVNRVYQDEEMFI
ncbi:MAG TPA: hypothetical protein VEF04_12040 [Blastocatellia bacterium]|nr:hypothetical protein [Blastocatellia bacterium]